MTHMKVKQEEIGAGVDQKEEDMLAEMKEEKMQIESDPAKNPFVAKFTQLWFACYFERRLTRSKVENSDLSTIVDDLIKFFASEGAKVDFRRAVPLLQGLHVLFNRKIGYLMKDSEHTLRSMSDPIDSIKVEGTENDENQAKATKRRGPNANAGPRQANTALQLNPNNFDWFLSGIDQTRLEGILGGSKTYPVDQHMTSIMKMEDTFMMVRDGGVGLDDPLNDVSMALGDRILPDVDDAMEGSAFRNLPDEAAGFEDALLRGDMGDLYQPVLDGDQSMFG